ncbi:amino acid deaminase [Colwelliaceae bacterium 6441]
MNNILEKGSGHLSSLSSSGWNLLKEQVSFPIAVINERSLVDNAKWMQAFSERAGVKLAPHGKTTMTPELFKLQLAHGCWGISLATVPQVINAYKNGIKKIILANQLVGRFHFELIADLLTANDAEFYCFVDSIENVVSLGEYFLARKVKLNVLIELGVPAGRCGWRDLSLIDELVAAISSYKSLQLCGVSFYEGVIHGEMAEQAITKYIGDVKSITERLRKNNDFTTQDIIITGAGSAWYDVVSKELTSDQANELASYSMIIRPGCYLIHDTGIYQEAQNNVLARSQLACDISGQLTSCLELWAYVHSTPEKELAIIGLGKRDVAFDAGLPTPEYVYRPGDKELHKLSSANELIKIMDQHCMMKLDSDLVLKPGDIIVFSSSHPCLTIDKWRYLAIRNDKYIVEKTLATLF